MKRPTVRGSARSAVAITLILSALRQRLFAISDERLGAAMLRRRIERLGGLWIKLGQTLALRRDLLPSAYCDEFAQLLDSVPPFSATEVHKIISRELGRPVNALFDGFENVPIASASIAQVHRAWRGHELIAVKVQRPDARSLFTADFALLRRGVKLGDLLGLGGGLSLEGLLNEFEDMTWRELDFREEAFSARLLGRNACGSKLERHVQSDPELSGVRVLTMGFARGRPLRSLLQTSIPGPDRDKLAERLLWNTLNQVYRFGVFHADPHPANLFVDHDGGITYVDHGQVGQIGDETRKRLLRFAWSMAEERFDEAASQMLTIARPTDRTDLEAVLREASASLARHVWMAQGLEIDRLAASPLDRLVMDIARRHRLAVAPELALYLKTISMVDSIVRTLSPKLDSYGLQYRFFARIAAQEAREALNPSRLLSTMNRISIAIEEGLALVARLDDAADSADAVVRAVRRRLAELIVVVLMGLAGAGVLSAMTFLYRWKNLFGLPIAQWILGCAAISVLASFGLFAQTFQLRRGDRRGALQRQRRSGTMPRNDWWKPRPNSGILPLSRSARRGAR